jgi:hypothetical protein
MSTISISTVLGPLIQLKYRRIKRGWGMCLFWRYFDTCRHRFEGQLCRSFTILSLSG